MTTETHPAAAFNVEDWLLDAHMPEESADVYKRADVIGELSALRRQIETHQEAAAADEKTAGDTDGLTTLTARYQELLETFAGSQLTVYTRALSPDEKRAIRAESEARTKDLPQAEQNADFGYALLARAIVAVRPFEQDRVEVQWTPTQVRALENKIGQLQVQAILAAHQAAQNQLPAVDADFLQKPSGEGLGQG